MSKRKDPFANEFGVPDDPFGGEPQRQYDGSVDSNPTRRQALQEVTRLAHLGELKPLNGRKVIERDWMDWEGSEEWLGTKRQGPSLAEINELHREYETEIDRLLSRPSAGMQDRNPDDQMPATAEALAEQLHREFTTAYKDLSGDSSAIERIARSEIETRGFSYADRHTLYERIANRLRAEGRNG